METSSDINNKDDVKFNVMEAASDVFLKIMETSSAINNNKDDIKVKTMEISDIDNKVERTEMQELITTTKLKRKHENNDNNETKRKEGIKFDNEFFWQNIEYVKNLKFDPILIDIEQLRKIFYTILDIKTPNHEIISEQLDFFIKTLDSLKIYSLDYGKLSGRLFTHFKIHLETDSSFSKTMRELNQWIPYQLRSKTLSIKPKYPLKENNVIGLTWKIISNKMIEYIEKFEKEGHNIDEAIKHERDFMYDYFAAASWYGKNEHGYLLRSNGKLKERIQYAHMRIALQLSGGDWNTLLENYEQFSLIRYTHASPTIFTSGADRFRPSSCFLMSMVEDSMFGIYESNKEIAIISSCGGGIGIDVSKIRPVGSHIGGSNGTSEGIPAMLGPYNATAEYANQGGNKRKGAVCVSMDSSGPDFMEFALLKSTNAGAKKCETLFYAIWLRDHFMKTLLKSISQESDEIDVPNPVTTYKLLNPQQSPGLLNSWGFEYELLYRYYTEIRCTWHAELDIKELFFQLGIASFQTGVPYLLDGDQANRLSNQNNVGLNSDPYGPKVIKSSNLCVEILQYSDSNNIACCNLASISLPGFVKKAKFIKNENGKLISEVNENNVLEFFNWNELKKTIRVMVRNLHRTIFLNYYPLEKCERTNKNQMPMAIGIQGLADVFSSLKITWDSKACKILNSSISEFLYFHFLTNSCEIAKEEQKNYPDYHLNGGSYIKNGLFHFELFDKNNKKATDWLNDIEYRLRTQEGVKVQTLYTEFFEECKKDYVPRRNWQLNSILLSGLNDWEGLRTNIAQYGVAHSLGIGLMPTASTAQLCGNFEGFEPYDGLFMKRSTVNGQFQVVVDNLVKDLLDLNIWDVEMKNEIFERDGSIQTINRIPQEIRDIYKNAYEINQSVLQELARDRQVFTDQSQSFSAFFVASDDLKENIMNFSHYILNSYSLGLKTHIYYNRQRKSTKKFTSVSKETNSFILNSSDSQAIQQINNESLEDKVCAKRPKDLRPGEECHGCG